MVKASFASNLLRQCRRRRGVNYLGTLGSQLWTS